MCVHRDRSRTRRLRCKGALPAPGAGSWACRLPAPDAEQGSVNSVDSQSGDGVDSICRSQLFGETVARGLARRGGHITLSVFLMGWRADARAHLVGELPKHVHG